ncbi:MAG: Holliday junction branch migration protein RuvA, partial [Proteobacteria bacterium]|nr:Holliday junction branch migration protein RuvA [Pseudomonadota bacterium]
DVGGVGYELQAPLTTFFRLPETGEQLVLHVHFVVREDAQLLYGFIDKKERDLFRSMIKVNGVGPKLALTILSGMAASEFVKCVRSKDVASLVRLPGVGKVTAERVIMELDGRLDEWAASAVDDRPSDGETVVNQRNLIRDAESALVTLGYKPPQAAQAIARVKEEDLDVEGLIKKALQNLG